MLHPQTFKEKNWYSNIYKKVVCMKIYDCFQFFDEDMMLDLRLNILDKYVHKFVIVENLYMHSGKRKIKILV